MSKNRIAVRTNKGEYIGGEKIYGAIYLWICSTEPCRGVKLKFKGNEKCEWEYREVKEENGRLEEMVGTRSYKKEKFRAESRLKDYEDGIPMGHYAYPFTYTLPHGLPGSFKAKGIQPNGDHWQAEILYSVTAEVEMSGAAAEVLQAIQYITVSESLPMGPVEQEVVTDTRKVKICCCIPRGDVLLTARLDKKAFVSGEMANLSLEVKNSSSVDIESFTIKLIRVVNLKTKDKGDLSGSHDEKPPSPAIKMPCISDDVITNTHRGCPSKDKRESEIPLELGDTEGEAFQATTKGQLIQCRYYIDANMDIPYALPILLQIPITLQAPKNRMWHDWEPPQWVHRCNIIHVTGPCAVPGHLLGSRLFANIPGFQADPFS